MRDDYAHARIEQLERRLQRLEDPDPLEELERLGWRRQLPSTERWSNGSQMGWIDFPKGTSPKEILETIKRAYPR